MGALDGLDDRERDGLRAVPARFVSPMLATLTADYFSDPGWIFEREPDGVRVVVVRPHRLIGMGGDQVVTALGGEELESRVGDDVRARQGEEAATLVAEMSPLPGARELLTAVKDRGHPVVPAGSGPEHQVDRFLDMLDARALADGWTTSADVESSKPAPDLLQVALRKLGASPDAPSVVVGNSVWDVEAAKRASMPALAVHSGGFGDDELRRAGAVALYDTPGDLADALDETPLA